MDWPGLSTAPGPGPASRQGEGQSDCTTWTADLCSSRVLPACRLAQKLSATGPCVEIKSVIGRWCCHPASHGLRKKPTRVRQSAPPSQTAGAWRRVAGDHGALTAPTEP